MAGTDGIQSDDECDMLATDIDVAMARAAILPEYVLEEKEDKASLFRLVSFVHSLPASLVMFVFTLLVNVTRDQGTNDLDFACYRDQCIVVAVQ